MAQNPYVLTVHSGFSPFFALPLLRSQRCAEVFARITAADVHSIFAGEVMKTCNVWILVLAGAMGLVMDAAAKNNSNVAEKRGLTHVVAAPGAGSSTLQPDYLLKACTELSNGAELSNGGVVPMTAENGVDPAGMVAVELENRALGKNNRNIYGDKAAMSTFKVTLLESPTHGKLIANTSGSGRVYYMYQPEPGYLGNDKTVFMTEFEGKIYKVVVDIKVLYVTDQNSSQCPEPQLIKVKSKPISVSSGTDASSISLNIADLPEVASGQTVGEQRSMGQTRLIVGHSTRAYCHTPLRLGWC